MTDASSRDTGRMIDGDLLDALSVPQRQGEFPRDSRAFVRIDTSLRIYWHTLFDICPGLLDLSGPDGLAIFRPFMAWASEERLSLNWTFYLWVDVWLRRHSPFRDRVTPDLRLSLIGASAARWATGDRSEAGGIALSGPDASDLVCGWKTRTTDAGRRVEAISLEVPLPMAPDPFGFFTVPGADLPDAFPGWEVIPR